MSGRDPRLSQMSPQRLALMAQELRSEHALINAEPIAIIGMGCRFPGGGNSPEALWRMLHDGVDAIREVPPERWDVGAYYDPDPDAPGKMYCKHGAFLDAIDQFDADFFGISPREAASMDPQQRILLEVTWEALERAGQSVEHLEGSATGVFVGISATDYLQLQVGAGNSIRDSGYLSMGNLHSVAAGRLSYLMGLRGPSMAVDTACSSSLLAVHLACQSLRNGECDLAVAGGVNLVLVPEITIGCCRFRMLAADGRCKTFDASADGYVRGEGCGMIVLKRYGDALASGDPVLALVRASAVNQDGRSNGLTAPSGPAQKDVIRKALASGGIDPHQIGYLEAHGTGTPLGDPIEFQAMASVLAADRAEDNPLIVGSVKTNIGHLESAAGIAGLMKVVLAMQHEEIPPHLNFSTMNPHIPQAGGVHIATHPKAWPRSAARRRMAGVSSFGFSGTNVHAILEEAPTRVQESVGSEPRLLTLSARTSSALLRVAARFADHFARGDAASFAADCYTANNGRSRFRHRLALVAHSPQKAREKLTAFAAGDVSAVLHGTVTEEVRPKAATELPVSGAARLEALGRAFVQGLDVDLDCADESARPRRTALPTYPFERSRFWLEAGQRAAPLSAAVHPLLGRRLPAATRETIYEARIGARSPAFLNDHRVQDAILFPASAYVEVALAAAVQTFAAEAHGVENLWIAEPLVLPATGQITVQCILEPESAGQSSFRICSQAADAGAAAPWTQHASGRIAGRSASVAKHDAQDTGDLREVQPDQHYQSVQHLGLDYGPAFRRLTRLRRRDMAAWGEARLPRETVDEGRSYLLHPTILDACLQILMAAVPREQSDAGYLPVGLDSLILHRTGVRDVSCVCQVTTAESGLPDTLKGDARIFDRDGALVAELTGFTCKRAPRRLAPVPAQTGAADSLYQLAWQPRESGYAEQQEDAARWLILGGGASAEILGKRLQSLGQECVYEADDLTLLRGVIDLRALNGETAAAICGPALHLAQTILQAHLATPPRLVLVTRGAQSTVEQAALWGLGRVIAVEHPELQCLLLDLDPGVPAEEGMAALLEELFVPARDREVAIRGKERLVPRLVRYPPSDTAAVSPLRPDASYLITGGFGALGLQVAERLAARGARNLILAGRNVSPSALGNLKSLGVRIMRVSCDVAHRDEVARLFQQIADDMPPLRGIVHAAGMVDDDPLIRQNAARLAAVLAPKIDGALNLHEASSDMPLDFFVLFSSIAALIGSRSQASYAAANAALDALAHRRHAMGLPAISINWGPWAGDGMAASLPASERQRLAKRGIGLLAPGQALQAFEQLLTLPCPQVSVFSADWAKLAQNPPAGTDLALLSELLEEGKRLMAAAPRTLFHELEQAPPARRHGILAKYIEGQVLDILQFKSSTVLESSQGFLQIGMDSLMAVELQARLQNALGVQLSSTLTFDQPTIDRLAAHLLDDVLREQLPRAAVLNTDDPLPSDSDGNVDSLSEDELVALLDQELGSAEEQEIA